MPNANVFIRIPTAEAKQGAAAIRAELRAIATEAQRTRREMAAIATGRGPAVNVSTAVASQRAIAHGARESEQALIREERALQRAHQQVLNMSAAVQRSGANARIVDEVRAAYVRLEQVVSRNTVSALAMHRAQASLNAALGQARREVAAFTTDQARQRTEGFASALQAAGLAGGLFGRMITAATSPISLMTMGVGLATVGLHQNTQALIANAREVRSLMAVSGLGAEAADNLADTLALLDVDAGTVTNAMFRMGQEIDQGGSALRRLGVNLFRSSGDLKTEGELFLELRDRISDLGSAGQRSAALMSVFGRSGRELAPAFALSRDEFKKFLEEGSKLSPWSEEAQRKTLEVVRAQNALALAWQGLKEEIGLTTSGPLTDFLNMLREAVGLLRTSGGHPSPLLNFGAGDLPPLPGGRARLGPDPRVGPRPTTSLGSISDRAREGAASPGARPYGTPGGQLGPLEDDYITIGHLRRLVKDVAAEQAPYAREFEYGLTREDVERIIAENAERIRSELMTTPLQNWYFPGASEDIIEARRQGRLSRTVEDLAREQAPYAREFEYGLNPSVEANLAMIADYIEQAPDVAYQAQRERAYAGEFEYGHGGIGVKRDTVAETLSGLREQNTLLLEEIAGRTTNAKLLELGNRLRREGVELTAARKDEIRAEIEEQERLSLTLARQRELAQDLRGVFRGAFEDVNRYITEAFVKGEGSAIRFEDVVTGVLVNIMNRLLALSITRPLEDALFGANPNQIGGLLGKLFGPSGTPTVTGDALAGTSAGGAYFARGGVVWGRTLFPMARGRGLMGEAGPEAVMPLRRTPSGDLGVIASPPGWSPGAAAPPEIRFEQKIINQAGSNVGVQAGPVQRGQDGRMFQEIVISTVNNAIAGGRFDMSNANRYGMSPRVEGR